MSLATSAGGMLLLNLILSYDAPRAAHERDVTRSWLLSERVEGYTHLFVIGNSPRAPYIQGDELWLPTDDTYHGGPAKILDAFRFVVEHDIPFKYLLKTDTDSLVCVSRLMAWLGQNKLPDERVYAGDPMTDFGDVRFMFHTKFADRNYPLVFHEVIYTRYHLGGGYLLSRDVVGHVVKTAREVGLLPGGKWREAGKMPSMEDALVGKLISGFANLTDLPVTGRTSYPEDYRLEVRMPSIFCRFILQPEELCHQVKGPVWCSQNAPLMIVHPIELLRPSPINESRRQRVPRV